MRKWANTNKRSTLIISTNSQIFKVLWPLRNSCIQKFCIFQVISRFPRTSEFKSAKWSIFMTSMQQSYVLISSERTNPEVSSTKLRNGSNLHKLHHDNTFTDDLYHQCYWLHLSSYWQSKPSNLTCLASSILSVGRRKKTLQLEQTQWQFNYSISLATMANFHYLNITRLQKTYCHNV